MKSHYRLAALIMMTALFAATFARQNAHAGACDDYKAEIEYYEKLRRNGGNAEEMNRWTAIGHELDSQYYRCQKDNQVVIQAATGNSPEPVHAPIKYAYKPLRHSSSQDDEQLQRLTQTCNYWIDVTNENPTQDNSNFRDTACRAVDNYESGQGNSPSDPMPVRTLKDCIKPHNLIDHEVNECVKGNIEPTWQKNRATQKK